MRYTFELYITTDTLTPATWAAFYQAVKQYNGLLAPFELTIRLTDNVVRFFVQSNKDLSVLSNSMPGLLLRPVNDGELATPTTRAKERLVQFVGGGNVLDLKEKYIVKKAKELEYAVCKIRGFSSQKSFGRLSLYFKDATGRYSRADKLLTTFPAGLLAINFTGNVRYLKKDVPIYLNIEKSLHMLMSNNQDALFEVHTFPFFPRNYYLNLTSYEFDRHSFIIGASGSGKSKFISLFVDRLSRTALRMNYRVVVIDPHASLADDFAHIPESHVISFGKHDSADLFPGAGTDLTSATELTATLFKSVMGAQFSPRLDRLLRFTLFTLLTAQAMSLENLKRFLTDVEFRNQILAHVEGYIPTNVSKFFGADYNELRTQYYNETILPLVSMVDEMQLQPSLVGESEVSLARTIQENFLTVFSLNKVSMGDKVVKTVAGLLIQQIFLLAQARAFGQKILLIIDEVSVVQNPALAQILAEARKFNLTVILTQQYFGQVEKDLRDAIFANVFNYYTFKVSEEDARELEGNLNIELPKELVEHEHERGLSESQIKIKIMTELHPRECLVRVLSNGQIAPCVKARTMDAPQVASHSGADLKPVEQLLPQKFVEGVSAPKRTLATDGSEPPVTIQASSPPPTARFSGVRDLLAMHSSSRAKITKDKDKPS
ncbi:MAG TPA: DUF87 domain-containing protein [Candidatus Saccharimonadales bacterium]|nr:DUF87 domain-containing protein [Candidatus Saccharimonadales bacterium]